MARILIVEDEKEMAQGLKDNFEFDNHTVLLAEDGESGLALIQSEDPDLMILDVMLPKLSGLGVLRAIREKGIHKPVIMLTARGQEMDKVLGLELGADDYITKPFSLRELLARVHAVLRRYQPTELSDPIQKIGRLQLDFKHFTAKDSKGDVILTHKEYQILQCLLQNAENTVSRDQLLEEVWGEDVFPTARTVDNQILKLRKKIEEDPAQPHHILTVHGIGYKMIL